MRIRWTAPAADDLKHIRDYQTEHYPSRASSTIHTIYEAVKSLKANPYRGRPGSKAATRELSHPKLPYVIVYWIKNETIEILHIWHGTQNRDKSI